MNADPTLEYNSTIADHALIGDCRTAALVSREGSINWLCLPNFSDPSIFASILDPNGGHFSIRPSSPFTVTRRYCPGTVVLETTFETSSGCVRVFDCLPVVDGIATLRPPREVLRIVEGVWGSVEMQVEVSVRADYARARPQLRQRGAWAGPSTGVPRAFASTAMSL